METSNILELKKVSKIYPGVKALDKISIDFRKGEVHAIAGENGAGKSTLIKIITGAIKPSEGMIKYMGKEHSVFSPKESLDLGICAVYQEFNLIPYLSIAENVYFGREPKKGAIIDYDKMVAQTKELLELLSIDIDVKMRVKDLSVAYQQIVEIAKAFSMDIKLLILDEPTAPLTNNEIQYFFKIVRMLKERGITVLYISHRLEEIFELSDRVTVMRDGQFITTLETSQTNRQELIAHMVGRKIGDNYRVRDKEIDNQDVVLAVKGLSNAKITNVSFELHRGEVLGLAGLIGAGRTEVGRAIFGADSIDKGELYLEGRKIKISSPRDAVNYGIALVPEDRKNHGIIKGMSVGENISITNMESISKFGLINKAKERAKIEQLKKELKIKTHSLDTLIDNLSGGNQQKAVLAKWLMTNFKVLIFDEPTRGIDVGAKQEIYALINEMSLKGVAIILISSEMPELLGMSDRIIVMQEGLIVGSLEKHEATQAIILDMASREKERV